MATRNDVAHSYINLAREFGYVTDNVAKAKSVSEFYMTKLNVTYE